MFVEMFPWLKMYVRHSRVSFNKTASRIQTSHSSNYGYLFLHFNPICASFFLFFLSFFLSIFPQLSFLRFANILSSLLLILTLFCCRCIGINEISRGYIWNYTEDCWGDEEGKERGTFQTKYLKKFLQQLNNLVSFNNWNIFPPASNECTFWIQLWSTIGASCQWNLW